MARLEWRDRIMAALGAHGYGLASIVLVGAEVVLGTAIVVAWSTKDARLDDLALLFLVIAFGAFVGLTIRRWSPFEWKALSDDDRKQMEKLRAAREDELGEDDRKRMAKLKTGLGREEFRVHLAVFFGYILVASAIALALVVMLNFQGLEATGLETATVDDQPPLAIRLEVPDEIRASPLTLKRIAVPFNASVGFTGTEVPAFTGQASVSIRKLDSPLALFPGNDSQLVLTNGSRSGSIDLVFDPTTGFRGESFNIEYAVAYNVSAPGLGNFTGGRVGTFTITFRANDFATGWYLMFIFTGILTSFWWRLANSYLGDADFLRKRFAGNQRIMYMVLLPLLSLVIALVVFRQFQDTLTASADPLVNGAAGFAYGFFWESAAQKFGKTVVRGLGMEETKDGGGPLQLSETEKEKGKGERA